MARSDTIGQLAKALASAQAVMPPIPKTKTGKVQGEAKGSGKSYEYAYKYADIADVLAVVQPVLGKQGLALMQETSMDGRFLMLTTILAHESGEWQDSIFPVCEWNPNPQKNGAALTYARRYALCSLIGVAADEDTDSAGAMTTGSRRAPAAPDAGIRRQIDAAKKPKAILDLMMGEEVAEVMTQLEEEEAKSLRGYAFERLKALGWTPPAKEARAPEQEDTDARQEVAQQQEAAPPKPERRRTPPAEPKPAEQPAPAANDTALPQEEGSSLDVQEWLSEVETQCATARTMEDLVDIQALYEEDLVKLSRTERETFEHYIEVATNRIQVDMAAAAAQDLPAAKEPEPPAVTKAQALAFRERFDTFDEYIAYITRAAEMCETEEDDPALRALWTGTKQWRENTHFNSDPRRDSLYGVVKSALIRINSLAA